METSKITSTSHCMAAIFALDETRNGNRDTVSPLPPKNSLGNEPDLLPQQRQPSATLRTKRLAKIVTQNVFPDRDPRQVSMENVIVDEFPYSHSRTRMTILIYLTLP